MSTAEIRTALRLALDSGGAKLVLSGGANDGLAVGTGTELHVCVALAAHTAETVAGELAKVRESVDAYFGPGALARAIGVRR